MLNSAHAAEILDYSPYCLQEQKVSVIRTIHHQTALPTDQDIRDIGRVQSTLADIKAEAQRLGYADILLTHFLSAPTAGATRMAKGRYKTNILALLANRCTDDQRLGNEYLGLQVNERRKVNSLETLNFDFQFEVDPSEHQRQRPKPVSLDVSPTQAFGIALGTEDTELFAMLGEPDYGFMQNSVSHLYGYGRGLWFQVKQGKVNRIQYGGKMLSASLQNMLPADSAFDASPWTLYGIKADNQTIESLTDVLGNWEAGKLEDRQIVEGDNRLTLKVETFHHDGIDAPQYRVKGFTLNYADESINSPLGPMSMAPDSLLNWLKRHQLTDSGTLPEPDFTYDRNYLWDTDGQLWYLINSHLLLRVSDGHINQMNFHQNWLVNREKGDIAGYLQALGLPARKPAFAAKYPDYLDFYDRYEAFTEAMDVAVQFDSDVSSAAVESATLIFRPIAGIP
ncbi:hypothetical protein [Shewanella sp. GXUN23E]|uniref:hypothetical protein n=1 Tax=Shewanella sp. GXUN23E TaxID=3422498 RepID=UPI003D7EAEFB